MGLPNVQEFDHCPITPECAAKKLFKSGDKFYRYDTNTSRFVEHTCFTAGKDSRLPEVVYSGQWKNVRTGRMRYTGPFRGKTSALKPPPDGGWTRKKGTGKRGEWELIKIMKSPVTWDEVTEE